MIDIISLLKTDQENIKRFKKGLLSSEEFNRKQEETSLAFFEYFQMNGFPCKKNNRNEIYKAGVTLSLHQPLERQKIILENVKDGCMEKSDQAFLVDKIRVQEGEEQEYGTQYKVQKGTIIFLPIKDKERVDEKREEVGLESLAEYKETAEANLRRLG
ncbi:MAG: DUF6624 domain-containing protein [Candidatus Paceibacterota bacterium]